MRGVAGVFSVQLPPTRAGDPDSEVRNGQALIDAAKSMGVESCVHTSVARAGDQKNFVGWSGGRWWNAYRDSKSAVNEAVRKAAFPSATILKPAYMMDNFSTPSMVAIAFPALKDGRIETQLESGTRLDMIAAEDVGRFAAAAFQDPERFAGLSIDLAAQSLTMTDVAAAIQKVKLVPVEAVFVSPEDALATGADPALVTSYEWDNVEGYKVDLGALAVFGISLTSFETWAVQHRDKIVIDQAA